MKKSAKITTKDLEKKFDEGEDVLEFFDVDHAEVEDPKTQRVNVDFPQWMVRRLDEEACRLGITRQSIIKFVINSVLTGRRFGARTLAPRWNTPSYYEDLFLQCADPETVELQSVESLLRKEAELRKQVSEILERQKSIQQR